jgi:hypothetical protein
VHHGAGHGDGSAQSHFDRSGARMDGRRDRRDGRRPSASDSTRTETAKEK